MYQLAAPMPAFNADPSGPPVHAGEQQASAAADRTSTQSFAETVEVSEVVRELAFATGTDAATDDLETKAALYVSPLRAVMRS